MSKTTITLLLAVALALIGGIGASFWMQSEAPLQISSGTLLGTPKKLHIDLRNADGKPFDSGDLIGHWTIVFAGYTHCPDVCPTTLAMLSATKKAMGVDGDRISVVFLSVDPQRDSADKLLAYAHYFNPDFTAVTADDATLERLGQEMGFVYEKVPSEVKGAGADDYLVDHSAALMLLDPVGRLDGYLTPPFEVQKLATDLKLVVHSTPAPRT